MLRLVKQGSGYDAICELARVMARKNKQGKNFAYAPRALYSFAEMFRHSDQMTGKDQVRMATLLCMELYPYLLGTKYNAESYVQSFMDDIDQPLVQLQALRLLSRLSDERTPGSFITPYACQRMNVLYSKVFRPGATNTDVALQQASYDLFFEPLKDLMLHSPPNIFGKRDQIIALVTYPVMFSHNDYLAPRAFRMGFAYLNCQVPDDAPPVMLLKRSQSTEKMAEYIENKYPAEAAYLHRHVACDQREYQARNNMLLERDDTLQYKKDIARVTECFREERRTIRRQTPLPPLLDESLDKECLNPGLGYRMTA